MSLRAHLFGALLAVGVGLQAAANSPAEPPGEAAPEAAPADAETPAEANEPAAETPAEAETPADAEPADAAPPAGLPPRAPLPTLTSSSKVVVVAIHGTIDLGLPPFVQRVLTEHHDADLLVLDVDTFGGRVDGAVKIRDALLGTEVPTLAFVNRRAISAGALISLAADHIVFTPGASLGAATPVEIEAGEMEAVGEKMVSYMRSEMRATAEATGRDGTLAEAMVDRTIVVEGVVDDTKLLTVSTELARRLHLADGVADNLDDLLTQLGAAGVKPTTAGTNWAEELARWLTDPTVAGLLMSIGMLGIMVELYSPGLGFPGLLGALCLAAFFGGHAVADLAGAEELLLLLLGFTALAIEAFLVPGFGIPGIIGLLLIVVAFALAMVGLPIADSWNLGLFSDAFGRVVWSLTATVLALFAVMLFVPASAVLPSFLVLKTRLGDGSEDAQAKPTDFHAADDRSTLVGKRGVAETDLRPSGKVRLDGRVIDVVSDHAWVARGTAVVVTEVEGVRVVVEVVQPTA